MIRALACLAVLGLLAGCGADAPEPASARASLPAPDPLAYDYLTKLPLDVSEVVVDEARVDSGGEHVEDQADPRPRDALARMIRDRVIATGGAGRAVATIEDASLVRAPGQLVGSFAVRIGIEGGAETSPPILASVSGTRTLRSDGDERATADALVKQLMDRMNVELEYQVRRGPKPRLGMRSPAGSPPGESEIRSEDLPPPDPALQQPIDPFPP